MERIGNEENTRKLDKRRSELSEPNIKRKEERGEKLTLRKSREARQWKQDNYIRKGKKRKIIGKRGIRK